MCNQYLNNIPYNFIYGKRLVRELKFFTSGLYIDFGCQLIIFINNSIKDTLEFINMFVIGIGEVHRNMSSLQ